MDADPPCLRKAGEDTVTRTMLSPSEFEKLAKTHRQGCMSIYMPTHRRGPEVRKAPIRLGNLLREARERAAGAGIDSKTTEQTLAPVHALLDETMFWKHQADGLAVLAAEGSLRMHRLPYRTSELVVAGDRYCVRPLLPAIDTGQRFFVLALSQNRVRLLECSRQSVRELDLHDIPHSLADALGYDWEQKSLQFHTGAPSWKGRHDAVFHGQGRGTDESKEEIQKFLQKVDAGVSALLRNHDAPLVLATVRYVESIYRQVNNHAKLMQDAIEGNPDESAPDVLRQRALQIVTPYLSREPNEQRARLASMVHTARATTDLETVLTAARDGRVETLFVAPDETLWGTFNAAAGTIEIHEDRRDSDEDLLDLAVASSLASGARVFAARKDELPDRSPVGSILRYGA